MTLITDFKDQKDLIKTWIQASKAEKEAKEQIEICKKALLIIDVEIGKPIFENIGIKETSRTTSYVPFSEIRGDFKDEALETFTKVEVGKLKKFMDEALEMGEVGEDEYQYIMGKIKKDKVTTYYQLNEFDNQITT